MRTADTTIIRLARPRDLDTIIELQKRDSNKIGFLPVAAIEEYMQMRAVTTAVYRNGVIGYALGRPSLRYARWCRPITQLVVTAVHRRQGIGTALATAMIAAARADGMTAVQAWSRDDLDAAHLWRSLDFTAVASREPPTARGIPATLWRLQTGVAPCPCFRDLPPVGGYRAGRLHRLAIIV